MPHADFDVVTGPPTPPRPAADDRRPSGAPQSPPAKAERAAEPSDPPARAG
jgi:hypothetical protein